MILNGNFTITAHTGCENTPYNSIESINKAFLCGADIFEVDVQFDKNGVPVLSHDMPTGDEPTLENAIQKLAEYKDMRCNLDIKNTENLKAVADIAKKYGVLDRIFYTGIFVDFTDAVKETPEIPYYLNLVIEPVENHSVDYLEKLVWTVKKYGAIGVNCQHSNVTEDFIKMFHNNNLLVSVWTCDKDEDIKRMINAGADNITSKRPSVIKELFYE